jgi:hypothetical protein
MPQQNAFDGYKVSHHTPSGPSNSSSRGSHHGNGHAIAQTRRM